MCGICGYMGLEGRPADAELVNRMDGAMLHRGPDGGDVYASGSVALGHRRLSIIDLSTGDQPMSTSDGELTVVFNGEIYNYLELKAELASKGHVFTTTSDTESILHGYRQWGEAVVEHLRGMFAFALWDTKNQRLVLARDRVGKKPLYYHLGKDHLTFASELEAVARDESISLDVDAQALDLYLSLGYVPSPRSIYAQVRKLPPAHVAVMDGKGLRMRRYWRLPSHTHATPPSYEAAIEELASVFDEAVRIRLMSDVPLGAFLSGGVDSSAVVAAMARINPSQPVRTAAIGFMEKQFNELDFARQVAEHYHTDHSEFTVEPKAADILGSLAGHFGEPFADASAIPTYYVSQMARQRVTVALSGDGGDEVFAGYAQRYQMAGLEGRMRQRIPGFLRYNLLGPVSSVYPRWQSLPRALRLKGFLGNLALEQPQAYARDMSFYFLPEDKQRLYAPDFARNVDPTATQAYLADFFGECEGLDPVGRAQYVDVMSYMTEDILVKVDRMSMAVSLEVRSPLLDHKLMEFAATLPSNYKLRDGRSKAIFKDMNTSRLPPDIMSRKKQGFRVPQAAWLRGELRDMCEQAVFSPSAGLGDWLDLDYARQLQHEHQSGQRDNANQLWALMMLGLWRQQCGKRS